MGTRALVRVFGGDEEIACIYVHHDGYPEGLGRQLVDWCATKKIVNGISLDHRLNEIANGASCLAAQLVQRFKDGPGGLCIYRVETYGCGEEYEYHLRCPHFTKCSREGSPVVVVAYEVLGGYGDKPRALASVEIPPVETSAVSP